MKNKSEMWQVTSDVTRRAPEVSGHPSRLPRRSEAKAGVTRHPQRGMALVITLILLAVTLVMAVAFLALARRERSAVATTTDTATARLAADSALAAAQAQIAAHIFASTNLGAYDFKLLVSTNYQNNYGFVPGLANPTNVNYDYRFDGNFYTAADLIQNVANLQFLPRPPVFVNTNAGDPLEFRYYLDLNRNGSFEDTGDQVANVVLDLSNNPFTNGFGSQVGDPQWIGVLERPDEPHGPNNPFVSRYAFLAQPIGNSLDLNYIHNQAVTRDLTASDGYFRNQGVGSWELNLAAFLTDLNTNIWFPDPAFPANYYQYNQPIGFNFNRGIAFDDARALLAYRYAFNFNNLATAGFLLNGAGNTFPYDNVDGYSDGLLQSDTTSLDESLARDNETRPWSGANNPNHFFSINSDLFDTAKVPAAFVNRLRNSSAGPATYNRYTFYRMLDQLGTDSSADEDKMNLNYRNVVNGAVVPGLETNLIPWTAGEFFTNAANRLLRKYTAEWRANGYRDFTNTYGTITTGAFGVTNIPVYVEGRFVYTPAVNRLLQLAANLYDATTNRSAVLGKDYPSVFRPRFLVVNTNGFKNVYIDGFVDVSTANSIAVGTAPLDPPSDITSFVFQENAGVNDARGNVYGVPWIIGAKKGLPNFNQFMNLNTVQVTRKLQLQRDDPFSPGGTASNPTYTNQMFLISITNRIGVAFWNSYSNNFVPNGNLTVFARSFVDMTLTNNYQGVVSSATHDFLFAPPATAAAWPGSAWGTGKPENLTPAGNSFFWKMEDYSFVPTAQYSFAISGFRPINATQWERSSTGVPVFPQFGLLTTNRLQAYILDGGRVIDYVHFASASARNISDEIANDYADAAERQQIANRTAMWDTNTPAGASEPTFGVMNQIYVSRFNPGGTVGSFWKNPANMPSGVNTPELESTFFNAFFMGGGVVNNKGSFFQNTNKFQQVPYTPTRTAWDYTLFQANDPLVHYLAGDMLTVNKDTGAHHADDLGTADYPTPEMNTLTTRYQPWGRGSQMAYFNDVIKDNYDSRLRDPLVWKSDDWDFPTSKLPGVGWIGRVHRGTPWQTVYLKSRNILADTTAPQSGAPVGTNTWAKWTGDQRQSFGRYAYWDAANTAPVRDGRLFDLFTTRFNENAAHGTLSVNQPHLAAWSAVFSGLVALTNTTPVPTSSKAATYTNLLISPAGVDGLASPLGLIVTNINGIRSGFVNANGVAGAFSSAGDILRVPALSDRSPFLNWNNAAQQDFGISDELYEWLPQQIMGLVRVSDAPRYAVYCYGQTLSPAPGGQVLSGPNFQMVTNYQVVAESAVRAVIRFDKQGTNYTSTVESYNPLPPD